MAVVRRFAAGLALAAANCMPVIAADFEDWASAGTWYVSAGVAQAPDIEEDGNGPSGASTYEWEGLHDHFAPRLALGYLACAGGSSGGWALGAELVGSTCNVTPERYSVGGLTFTNTSGNTLRYSTVGATLSGGYQFGITEDAESLSSFLLIAPFVGGGAAFADSELPDAGNTYEKSSGIGWYLEGGLRGGFFLSEKHWVMGVVADLTYSTGEVDIDYSQGRHSTLTHERSGVGGALVIGYRP